VRIADAGNHAQEVDYGNLVLQVNAEEIVSGIIGHRTLYFDGAQRSIGVVFLLERIHIVVIVFKAIAEVAQQLHLVKLCEQF